ncbi:MULTISPECIES: KilA-N domain-containing protein [Giesbergeria]|uniref:KilA-N domain-containing protein n=1 Tax=Giesbergeria sinuosa TaxID=80883 RepID=A0ABV9QCK0_9BURK
MSNSTPALTIGGATVRRVGDLFSLNDLHKAAGGEAKHKPSEWLRNQQAQDLLEEIQKAGIPAITSKPKVGTYASRELVIAYAAWISAAFHLKVIRVFLDATAPTPAQRPYDPAIDYTRISPAQAQDIKELVHQVVDSGVQTFGETWNRLHHKFRVNSYLELPATKYDEVCAYLRGKLPDGYANSVVFDTGAPMPPVLDLQRIHAAMQTATQAGAQVQQAVFESVLAGNDEWKFGRWLLSFVTDSKLAAPAVIQRVGHDEFVTSTRQLIDCINDPGFLLSNTELAGLAQACTNRLARRLGGGAGSMAA